MEVSTINPQALDLDFHGSIKPAVGDYYFSAPTSPDNLYQFYQQFDDLFRDGTAGDRRPNSPAAAAVRSHREENPSISLEPSNSDDFAFDVGQDWETASLSAEELFDGGVIKPLTQVSPLKHSPAPRNSAGRKIQGGAGGAGAAARTDDDRTQNQRGRDALKINPSKSRAVTRSLSPAKGRGVYRNNSDGNKLGQTKKWRLKDLFLLRSASEGRAAEKDVLKKYSAAAALRRPSMRAIEASGRWRRMGGGGASAHEVHYTVNRAISEDLKKKTFLPYKQGIVGRFAFNPAVHALANGFGFSRRS